MQLIYLIIGLHLQLCSLPVEFHYPGKKMTLDCLVPPEAAAAAPMAVPLEPKALRRAARNAAGKTKGTASGAAGIPVEDLTGEEESNTFTFIHKRERKEGPHVEAVAALTYELENLKNSVGLLAFRIFFAGVRRFNTVSRRNSPLLHK